MPDLAAAKPKGVACTPTCLCPRSYCGSGERGSVSLTLQLRCDLYEPHELLAVALAVGADRTLGERNDLLPAQISAIARLAEHHAVARDRHRKAKIDRRLR